MDNRLIKLYNINFVKKSSRKKFILEFYLSSQ